MDTNQWVVNSHTIREDPPWLGMCKNAEGWVSFFILFLFSFQVLHRYSSINNMT
jgi:hypothetical protein